MKSWKKMMMMMVLGLTVTATNNQAAVLPEGDDKVTEGIAPADLISDGIIPVSSIKLNLGSITLTEGKNRILGAIFEPRNATDKTLTWSSSDTSVAEVTVKGMVIAKTAGKATIAAKTKDGNEIAISVVTVEKKPVVLPSPITGIKINLESFSLPKGKNRMLAVYFNPSVATNQSVVWSSSNKNVATVSENGMVSAKGIGTATILVRALDGNKMASSVVTVAP